MAALSPSPATARPSPTPPAGCTAGLFLQKPPRGDRYDDIARRLRSWLDETATEPGGRLIVMHGNSSRVLRAVLTGAPDRPPCRAPAAPPLRQGSVVCIEAGVENVL